jgi:Zinc carboxypeptidase/IPT/TIG domain
MPAPTITTLIPAAGRVGDSVVIAGMNFIGASAVRFNGFAAVYVVDSPTKITATVPAAMIGSGKVAVTTPAGTGISGATFTLMTRPLTVAAIQARLAKLATDHPTLCAHFSYTDATGAPLTTAEGRPLTYVKIGQGGGFGRPAVLVVAGLHAREWGPPEAVLSFAERLLASCRDDTDIVYPSVTHFGATHGPFRINKEEAKRIVDRLDLYVAPLVNPDGRAYTLSTAATTLTAAISDVVTIIPVASAAGFPAVGPYDIDVGGETMTVTAGQGTTSWTVTRGLGGLAAPHPAGAAVAHLADMWRKNRRTVGTCIGVDINRNFDVAWDFDTYYDLAKLAGTPLWLWDHDDFLVNGSTPRTKALVLSSKSGLLCDEELYRGPSAASEVETQFVQWLAEDKKVRFFLDVHSYGRNILYPWSLEENQSTDDSMNLRQSSWDKTREGVGGTYREYFPNDPPDKLLDAHRLLAQKLADEIVWPSRGSPASRTRSTYTPGPGIGLYRAVGGLHPPDPVPAASDDWVFSRQITAAGYDASRGPIFAFTIECGLDDGEDGGFHPQLTGAMPKIEREVHLALRAFLRHAATPSQCLIGTAAHGTPAHADVEFLRYLRDRELQATPRGRRIVGRAERVYYGFSPQVARFLDGHRWARALVRAGLTPAVGLLRGSHAALRPVRSPGARGGLLGVATGLVLLAYAAGLTLAMVALAVLIRRLLQLAA